MKKTMVRTNAVDNVTTKEGSSKGGWFVIILSLILVLGTGCQAKAVGGDTGVSSVFDKPIDFGDEEEARDATITEARINAEGLLVKTDQKDQYYRMNLDDLNGGKTFILSPESLVEPEELSLPVLDEEATTGVAYLEGYLDGYYYGKAISDKEASVVFVEKDQIGLSHLDLISLPIGQGEKLVYLKLTKDLNTLLYALDKDGQLSYFRHELDKNETRPVGEPGQWVLMDDLGSMILLNAAVKEETVAYTYEASNQDQPTADNQVYDIVLRNGIIMDPSTDTIKFGYDLGLIGDTIKTISDATLEGQEIIDVTGLIVSPGFIDMLGFNMNTTVAKYKITDGVTTNLSMHGCTNNFDAWFKAYDANPPYVNYGGAVFAIKIREEAGLDYYRKPTEDQITFMAKRVEEEILAGGVALAFSPEYYPGTTPEEIRAMMKVAVKYNIPTHFHLRYSSITGEDIGIKGVEEAVGYAKELGARVQIMHLHSTGGTGMMVEALDMINAARAEGADITFDIYPYDSWASQLQMARFREGWQDRYGITYEDLQIAGTKDRLNQETFSYYKHVGGLCIAYAMEEAEMLMALSEPYAMVGSDGNIDREDAANNHFRGAGTFSRILGKYVREEDVFSLMEGLRKMTINSARQLEPITQDMALRGRLLEGMIGDITVFDYKSILDQSTAEVPATPSKGIAYVLVNGQIGLRDYTLDTSVRAGSSIRTYLNKLED